MTRVLAIYSAFVAHLALSLMPVTAIAKDNPIELLGSAKALYAEATTTPDGDRVDLYRQIQVLLDQIVEIAPQSDTALDILFRRPIDGIDLASAAA